MPEPPDELIPGEVHGSAGADEELHPVPPFGPADTITVDQVPLGDVLEADAHMLPGEDHVVDELEEQERKRNFWALVFAQAASVGYGALRTAFLAVIVGRYTSSAFAISFAVTANRWLAFIVNPVVGRLSDTSRSRHGRRKPFMVVGMTVMGLAMLAVPQAKGYWLLVGLVVVGSIGGTCYRLPRFAATPELFGQKQWATMLVSIGAAGVLPNFIMQVVINRTWAKNQNLTFVIAGIAGLAGAVVIALRMREPVKAQAAEVEKAAGIPLGERLRRLRSHRNLIVLASALGVFVTGAAGIGPLYVIYAGEVLGVGGKTVAAAGIVGGLIGAPLLLPVAIVALRTDRRKTGVIGALVGSVLAAAAIFANNIVQLTALSIAGAMVMAMIAINLGTVFFLLFPRETLAEVAALLGIVFSLASLATTYGTALAVDAFGSYRIIWAPMAVGALGAAAILTRLDLPKRHRKPDRRGTMRMLSQSFGRSGLVSGIAGFEGEEARDAAEGDAAGRGGSALAAGS